MFSKVMLNPFGPAPCPGDLCDPGKFEQYANETLQRLGEDPFVDDCHLVPQAYYLSSKDGRRLCDHIIRYEHLQTELTQLLKWYHNLSETASQLRVVNQARRCDSVAMSPQLRRRLQDARHDAEMSATDQFRVIFDGPMKESRDPVEILYGRVKRFLDMELQLRAMSKRSNHDAEKAKKQPSAKMQDDWDSWDPSRPREATKPKILEGSVKGVGGVIEAMQKKYAMVKGERLRVVNETKDLWKLEGEKTVPKCQMNTGWKWVVKGAEDEVKKKQEETARKKEAKRKAEAAKSFGQRRGYGNPCNGDFSSMVTSTG
eukprot:g18614.t1